MQELEKNMAEEMSERVDRFLRKDMSKKEMEAFIEEVKSNPELKEDYQRQFELMRAVKMHQMSMLMKEKEKELTHVKPTVTSIPFYKNYRYAISTFAVAASLLCGVFVWDNNVTKSVGGEYLPVIAGMTSRGPVDDLLAEGKYQEAIDLIDEELNIDYDIVDVHAMNELKYKKALILLKMGKKHKAKLLLKEIGDARSKEVLNKLLW